MTDLDMGGTPRDMVRVNCGPTIGWVMIQENQLDTIHGDFGDDFGDDFALGDGASLSPPGGTWLITVDVNATLAPIQLPSAIPPNNEPITYIVRPITIVDTGGYAGAFPITIVPSGGETINGLSSLAISTAFGAYVLTPNVKLGGWTTQ